MALFDFYQQGSTPTTGVPINSGNPIQIGAVEKGMASDIITINLWNHRNNVGGTVATAPTVNAVNGSGDASAIFNGTTINGFKSMLEARSCDAYGVAADKQQPWVPIRPSTLLTIGTMPANSMRTLELRLNVPPDSPVIPIVSFALQASA